MSELSPGRLLILAGERGLGKTSVCRAIAAAMAADGRSVGGLLTHSMRDEAGIPRELELEALGGGERRRLASRSADLGGPRLSRRKSGPTAGDPGRGGRPPPDPEPFSFSAETLSWALDLLEAELARGRELLIVDEIGPLELELGLGLRPFLDRAALAFAAGSALPSLLLTVRPSLAAPLAALLRPRAAEILSLGLENRATLPLRILGTV